MKLINKKIIFIPLLFLLVLSIILITNNRIKHYQNISHKQEKLENDEVELDNWEISAVFYDSKVGNGKTPLTEINWDASRLPYNKSEIRVITVQINYKNTNVTKDYEPGEVVIKMPKLIGATGDQYIGKSIEVNVTPGANDATHSGFDWTYRGVREGVSYYDNPNYSVDYILLYNAKKIEKKSNLEGSIQIKYEITSKSISPKRYLDSVENNFQKNFTVDLFYPDSSQEVLINKIGNPHYDNELTPTGQSFIYNDENNDNFIYRLKTTKEASFARFKIYNENEEIIHKGYIYKTIINYSFPIESNYGKFVFDDWHYSSVLVGIVPAGKVSSNELSFNFHRLYRHPWVKKPYNLIDEATNITNIDNLPEDYDDYIWVRFKHNTDNTNTDLDKYPNISVYNKNSYVLDDIPDDVLVLDKNGNVLAKKNGKYKNNLNDSTVIGTFSSSIGGKLLFLGFPKSIYNVENNNTNITINSEYWGRYENEVDDEILDTDSTEINLLNYHNVVPEGNYAVAKVGNEKLYTQDIRNGRVNTYNWTLGISANYTGKKMTLKIGDDLLYITDENGSLVKLEDDNYYFKKISLSDFKGNDGFSLRYSDKETDCELWVRYRNNSQYILYKEFKFSDIRNIEFTDEEKVAGFYLILKDITSSVIMTYYKDNITATTVFTKQDIANSGTIYNYNYLEVYNKESNGELTLVTSPSEESYNNLPANNSIKEYDLDEYNHYMIRSYASSKWELYNVPEIENMFQIEKSTNGALKEDALNEKFSSSSSIRIKWEATTRGSDKIVDYYKDEITDNSFVKGFKMYDLLPRGMKLVSSEKDILNSLYYSNYDTQHVNIYDKNKKRYLSNEEVKKLLKNHTNVTITRNYKNTNRTKIDVIIDFSDNPLVAIKGNYVHDYYTNISFGYDFEIDYNSIMENGNSYTNRVYAEFLNPTNNQTLYGGTYEVIDDGRVDIDARDINNNSITNERLTSGLVNIVIVNAISTNQDVQVSTQTDLNDYETIKATSSFDSEYNYKLRVRTGQNDVTNLIIYDSIEKYAKDSSQSFINAYGVRKYWQGEFLGVDTSYAKSKGYNVKVYYSESAQPGSLKEDASWQEYTDSIDKTKVKSLAFEYLDKHGDPAIVPANSLTYVLVKMQAPTEEYKTFTYNGCWTEWNAIDPKTNQPVDFVTGINSNIVKVALPSSIEPEDIELTLTKKWNDNSNSLNKRPENVTFRIIPNDDYSKATDVTFSGTGNTWTYNVTVPKYDDDGEEIEYTIKEDTINLEDNYKYVPSVDNYEVTNTLYKNIIVTKNWLDNNNSYLTRPPNITVKVYQNGNYYKDLNITGDYSTNTWTGSLSVPVFDNSGNEYTYTVDEISVDNYKTSCENLVCTNLLTGEDKITITKEWIDKDNEYQTRPSSINVILKQNGNDYQDVTLTGNDSTWESDEITVPMYDNNGVKYTYTIIENTIPSYGLVDYDQENFKITNTLKEKTLLTITKIWKDNNNEYGTRPDSLSITLLQNGTEYQTISLSGNTNTWTTTIEVPKYDDNQQEYTYTIKEVNDNLEDYQDITYSDDDLTVTNGLKKDYDLTITNKWIDHNNDYQTRPNSINVKILQNGEEYQAIEMSGNSNEWTKTITVPYYDSNNKKYEYTIVEDLEISKYGCITYDQTTYTITNELTDIPKVTVYFTVLNGYVEPGTSEIKYDEEGFREMLKRHNIDPDSDYEFTFELQNIETNEIYEGKLSTKGILEFEDIPYGDYRALEGKDDIFEFVSMESIGDVLGVKFTPGKNGGIISISPTGQDIIYGANITNKITAPMKNPNTSSRTILLVTSVILLVVSLITILLIRKRVPKRFILPTN